MFNLIIKDIRIQKKDKTLLLFILLNLLNIFIYQKYQNMSIFLCFISVYILVIYANAYDFKYHSELLINSVPINRQIVVGAKYLSVIFYLISAVFITFILGSLMNLIAPVIFHETLSLNTILIEIIIINLYYIFYFPIYFKVGYLKSRWINFIMMTVMGTLIGVQNNISLISLIIILGISIIFLIISSLISYKIYLNKEF